MIIVRLQISGFLSYNERVEIDFNDFTLACISGENGAGKSSLLEAITWALFGEARRKDDAVINLRAKTAEVILDFDYEGARYQVQRSKTRDKSTLLEFRMRSTDATWHALTEATMRATEDLIRRTLHLDYETFINASFFLQGKADLFAQQRPGDRKRILSGILGLDIWEEYREEAARRRREMENELALIRTQIEDIDNELKLESERKAKLARLEKDLADKQALFDARKVLLDQQRLIADRIASDQKQVEKQAAEVQRVRGELEEHRQNLEQRLQEQVNHRALVESEDQVKREVAEWENSRQVLSQWDAVAVNFHQYETQRQAPVLIIESERTRLKTELDALTRKQVEVQTLEESLPALQRQVDELAASVSALTEQLNARADIENEMHLLLDEKAHTKAENIQLKIEMDELKDRISRLQVISGAICPTCEKPLNSDERERLLQDLEIRGKTKGDTYRENQKKAETWDARYRELEMQLAGLQRAEAELKQQQRQADFRAEELRKSQLEVNSWHASGEKSLNQLLATLRDSSFALEARAELASIDEQLKALGYDAAAHEKARDAELAGRSSQDKLLKLEQAKSALSVLEREITNLQKSIAAEESRLAALMGDLQTAREKLQQESANLPDISQLEAEYYAANREVNSLQQEIGYTRNQVEVLDSQRERKAELIEEKTGLNDLITNLKTLERAFGKDGIPALLIEQALPDIEAHANEILDRLSAGEMSVKFETQREFKDKKRDDRKETLDILIRDSAGERPYELFSGGEAFRVNFAIRLALSRVLSMRAGARLQTLVIDEGFGSQDASGRQRLVEAINLVGADFARILVITHLEELKDAFPARIEVTKTHEGSRVQVIA